MQYSTDAALKTLRLIFAKDDERRTAVEREVVQEIYALVRRDQLGDRVYLIGLAMKIMVEIFKKRRQERTKEEETLVAFAFDAVEQESLRARGVMTELQSHHRKH